MNSHDLVGGINIYPLTVGDIELETMVIVPAVTWFVVTCHDLFILNCETQPFLKSINKELELDAVSLRLRVNTVGVPVVFHVCVIEKAEEAFVPVNELTAVIHVAFMLDAVTAELVTDQAENVLLHRSTVPVAPVYGTYQDRLGIVFDRIFP